MIAWTAPSWSTLSVLSTHSLRATCADDLALQVFQLVSQEDKLRLSLVCKPWRKLLAESPTLWQTFSGKMAPACLWLHSASTQWLLWFVSAASKQSLISVLCTVNPPPKRTLASLSSLLEFLQRHKPCVRQLTFQPKDFLGIGWKWHNPDNIQADHALAPLLCAVGPHLRELTCAPCLKT